MTKRKYINPPRSEDCVWRDGPPPEIGWWPASIWQDTTILRWWDGVSWSFPARDHFDSEKAASYARVVEYRGTYCSIRWTDRWWGKR